MIGIPYDGNGFKGIEKDDKITDILLVVLGVVLTVAFALGTYLWIFILN